MKLTLGGNLPINRYYVQMLCMIYFPGAKFSETECFTSDTPWLDVVVNGDDNIVKAICTLTFGEKKATAEKDFEVGGRITRDRAIKLAIGGAMYACGEEVLEYRPSWGILTGVRPSKVATEFLLEGNSKTKVRKILATDYCVLPKKAVLATNIARTEQKIIGTPQKRDCSVYISIPFCPSRCSYCSFVSYTSKKLLSLIPEYLVKLCKDIKDIFSHINRLGMNVKSIYIGGGTPTILSAEQLRILLHTISECTDVTSVSEYTLEGGRPDTIDAEKLRIACEYGVTRISVNPQSLCDMVLEGVGRLHTSDDFYKAYDIARESGIKCINTDLIVGLPGDNFKTFSKTFNSIIKLAPENITVHTFCVKKSADLIKQGPNIFSLRGGDAGKCVDYSQLKAVQNGYIPYYMYRQKNTVGNFENVGFAKEGTEGLYNIYMMEEVHTIFSAGAGAVTKLVEYDAENPKNTRIKRLFNPKYPYEYLANNIQSQFDTEIEEFFKDVNFD